jgi:type IV pilus assembly protein PilP
MKRNLNSTQYAAALLLLAMLFGCSKKENPAPATPPQAVKAQPVKPAVPVAPVQTQLSSATKGAANLDFKRRNDPFKPFAPAVEVAPPPRAGQGQPAHRAAADLLPIQTFEVGKFKVVGIIAGLKENRALLIDPTGKGYVVHEGMLIGSNDGRITRITASTVEVVERFKESNGRVKKRTVVLTLAKKR